MLRIGFAVSFALASALIASPAAAAWQVNVHGGIEHLNGSGISKMGQAGGVGVGYDYWYVEGHGFFGAEVDGDLASTKECDSNVIVAGDRACGKAGRDLSAILRFGYKPNAGTAVYGLIGYANTRKTISYASGSTSISNSQDLSGIRLGAGAEFGIGSSAFARIEYRYTGYRQGYQRHQGMIGLGFHF